MSIKIDKQKSQNLEQWKQRIDIIRQIIIKKLVNDGERNVDTDVTVAAFLETSVATYRRWKAGKKVPDTEVLELLATKLNLSANWLLLGIGEPEIQPRRAVSECDVHIADTLRDLVVEIDRPMEEIALTGGMYPRELELVIARGKGLPTEADQRWVHAYHINANFLLAQVGQPFLTEDEYAASGSLSWVRERRGDFTYRDEEDALEAPLSTSERARLYKELGEASRTIAAQQEALALYREMTGRQLPGREKGEGAPLPKAAGERK